MHMPLIRFVELVSEEKNTEVLHTPRVVSFAALQTQAPD